MGNNLDNLTPQHLEQHDFLLLMVAQMKNQQENNVLKHASIEQLASSLQSKQALQASVLVGRKVLVNNNKVYLGLSGTIKLLIQVLPNLSHVHVFIYSTSAALMKIISLGQPEIGLFEFFWDGTDNCNQRVPAGTYLVEVKASCDENDVALDTMTLANVDSVALGHNGLGLRLNVAGVGSIALAQVKQISV